MWCFFRYARASSHPILGRLLTIFSLLPVLLALTALSLSGIEIPQVNCQEAESCFKQALMFEENNPEQTAKQIELYQQAYEAFPDSVWGHRAQLRLALAYRDINPSVSLSLLQSAEPNFPDLKDYVMYWKGEALFQLGETKQAAHLFQAVLENFPVFSLQEDLLFGLGQAWFEADECESAMVVLRRATALFPDSLLAGQALLQAGECAERIGKMKDAQSVYQEIWWRFPNTPEAAMAFGRLQDLLRQEGGWRPSVEDQYNRAKSYYQLAFFPEAITDLQNLLQQRLPFSLQHQARFKLGMAFVRLKQYPQAERIFKTLVDQGSPHIGSATEWLAKVLLREDKGQELLALTKSLHAKVSPSKRARVLWMSGIWLEDQERIPEALEQYEAAAKVAGSAPEVVDVFWRMGWIYYQQKQFDKAVEKFEEMAKQATTRDDSYQAQYWEARSLDQSQLEEKAQSVYRELASQFPLTYYGQLAYRRLKSGPDDQRETAPVNLITREISDVKESSLLQHDLHFQKAVELSHLGLLNESQLELGLTIAAHSEDSDALVDILVFLTKVRAFDQAVLLAKRYFLEDLERGRVQGGLWSAAYPQGYLPAIRTHVGTDLDPFLIAGIIREESLYDPEALSPVGAVGLMQLMPATANRVAQNLGLRNVSREQLFQGEVNIQLGTWYVRQLSQEFQGNLVQIIAAYNAGPPAVRRWISRFGNSPEDEFVEQISYRETRGYVKRVLTSYRAYHYLSPTTCRGSSLDRNC